MIRWYPLSFLALFCATVASIGCGGARTTFEVPVSGMVTVAGEPVTKGAISFVSVDGETPAGGGSIQDGVYRAQVPPGEKIVVIHGNKLVGQQKEFPDLEQSAMQNIYQKVTPSDYGFKHLSPLKVTIDEAQEGLDFDLPKAKK
ncbi:hypothetical protein M4951_24990 [Blastopirellula sp. J2-11]|uniref:hypothetical protein n=1 Tax=Blastopirellula sp. J2-11 TaxID=2943192 RepID=UPI0021C7F58B|nr:hypothetical protein [Blastopirellula sp. J2-11]UUO06586.1 hypothetical protein M4951_24990 [Blastopirellula sp. J2-11]